MKRTNNDCFRLLTPFSVIGVLILLGQFLIVFRLEMPLDEKTGYGFLKGLLQDLPVLVTAFIVFLSINNRGSLGRGIGVLLFLGLLLTPIADLICLNLTYARFNYNVWNNFNFYSIKAVLSSSLGFQSLAGFMLIVLLLKLTFAGFKRPFNLRNRLLIVSGLTLLLSNIALFSIPQRLYSTTSNFLPNVEKISTMNSAVFTLGAGCYNGVFSSIQTKDAAIAKFQEFSNEERKELENQGLLPSPDHRTTRTENKGNYKRIILIIYESLAKEYFHHYNKAIPEKATYFFDFLLKVYPGINNFYTSETPTINGLSSLFMSKIPYSPNTLLFLNNQSIFSVFKKQTLGKSIFIRGISKYYGNEKRIIDKAFQFDETIFYEELEKSYPPPSPFYWGYHDDVIFSEAVKKLMENQSIPLFLVLKTIDTHQPPSFCGIPDNFLPSEVSSHPSKIVKSLFWTNECLVNFFTALSNNKLLDDQTLIIITSDHYPPAGSGHTDLLPNESYNPLGMLPMLFVSKNIKPLKKMDRDQIACQLDFAPTIADLIGAPVPQNWLGNSMIDNASSGRAISFNDGMFYLRSKNGITTFPLMPDENESPALLKWKANLFSLR